MEPFSSSVCQASDRFGSMEVRVFFYYSRLFSIFSQFLPLLVRILIASCTRRTNRQLNYLQIQI